MIEIKKIEKAGFYPQFTFEGWKTAFVTYSENYSSPKVVKRHIATDEVFVLIKGKGVIYTIDDGKIVKTVMKK